MLRIGLTGSIASGKSFVSEILRNLGIPVLDADELSREASKAGSIGLKKIEERFGSTVISDDGELNRRAMAKIIFSDDDERKYLEAILHPIINDIIQERFLDLEKDAHDIAVIDAALLLESGFDKNVDYVCVVVCDNEIRKRRLMERNSLSEDEAQIRMESQMPQDEKISYANWVIDNSGDRERTKSQVLEFVEKLRST